MAKVDDVVVIDFETKGIESRPHYPPIPVGVSMQFPGERDIKYHCWGHPTKNNCSKAHAQKQLSRAWRMAKNGEATLLFHHSKFDYDVATTHMGMSELDWSCLEDTMFEIFMADPHSPNLSLKPSAKRMLGMATEEQDAVKEWLIANRVVRRNQRDWGAHIWEAPGDVVGRYANGDVKRTKGLHKFLKPQLIKRGMLGAYDRERELMPILLENEREGVRIDLKLLEREEALFSKCVEAADEWLRRKLGAPELNVDSNDELADALETAGVVTEWIATANGKRSTSKKNMTLDLFKDERIYRVLGWRNRAQTCLGTYMRPWLAMARASGGRIHLNWNQVRQMRNGDQDLAGARTGRMSSSNPNLMAVSKKWGAKDDYVHPVFLIKDGLFVKLLKQLVPPALWAGPGLPSLPLVRRYVLPDTGGLWCHRDYNQQELRILGHYENGELMRAYNENPLLDVHEWVRQEIKTLTGILYEREHIKTINFGTIYGRGARTTAEVLNITLEEARALKRAQLSAVPGFKDLNDMIKETVDAGEPIVTWGGREYYCEPPKIIDGRLVEFAYKLLNYLIQGSAADCTKQAIINYSKRRKHGRWMLAVHDENNITAPKGAVKEELKILRECMQDVKFDVPMTSDAKTGKNWADLEKFKEAA